MSQKTATEKERRIFSLKKHYLLTISQKTEKPPVMCFPETLPFRLLNSKMVY
jgi:hypothetical protein